MAIERDKLRQERNLVTVFAKLGPFSFNRRQRVAILAVGIRVAGVLMQPAGEPSFRLPAQEWLMKSRRRNHRSKRGLGPRLSTRRFDPRCVELRVQRRSYVRVPGQKLADLLVKLRRARDVSLLKTSRRQIVQGNGQPGCVVD